MKELINAQRAENRVKILLVRARTNHRNPVSRNLNKQRTKERKEEASRQSCNKNDEFANFVFDVYRRFLPTYLHRMNVYSCEILHRRDAERFRLAYQSQTRKQVIAM